MMKMILLFILSVFLCKESVDAFSSVEKLAEQLDNEEDVIQSLEESVESMKKEIDVIKRYVSSYHEIESQGLNSIELVSHPVSGYVIMKRLVNEWKQVEEAKERIEEEISNSLKAVRGYPKEGNLNVTAKSIMTLQTTYEQQTSYLSDGLILDYQQQKVFQSDIKLSAEDCLHMGHVAMDDYYYDIAIDWYEAALTKTEMGDDTANEKDILKILDNAVLQHDLQLEKKGPGGFFWRTHPIPFDPDLAKHHKYTNKLINTDFKSKLYQSQSYDEDKEHARRLCRGETMLPDSVKDNLSCRYVTNNDPYLYLMPMKVEEHSMDPYIAVFHDFLRGSEIEEILETAKPDIAPSTFYSSEDEEVGNTNTGSYRTSENAWLDRMNITDVVSRRIERATKLNAIHPMSSELYQVANYGVGGQYNTHTDFLQDAPGFVGSDGQVFFGDRIATFVVYLSDVDAGGATVFPRAGVTVWPKKGSGLFWWNLFRNGDGDENTVHAGCPVLHGSKWIANKWLRERGQQKKAPCDVHPLKKFTGTFWSSSISAQAK